jgi:hypothetical protein
LSPPPPPLSLYNFHMDMAHKHSFTKNTNPESSTILIGFEDIMK